MISKSDNTSAQHYARGRWGYAGDTVSCSVYCNEKGVNIDLVKPRWHQQRRNSCAAVGDI